MSRPQSAAVLSSSSGVCVVSEAVIFDMDGTLCDVSAVRHFVEGEDRNFDAFHAASMECPPHQHVVDALRQAQSDGHAILIVTARSSKWRDYTIKWLDRLDITFDRLYMRFEADFRPDYVIKKDILKQIIDDHFRPIHAWDDSPKIIALWRDNGIEVTEVPQ